MAEQNLEISLLKLVFLQRSSSIEGRLLLKLVFCERLSSVKSRLPSKIIFCQRSSSVKIRLPSKVVFHRRSSSSFGSFSFLGLCPGPGAIRSSVATLYDV